MNKKRLEEIKLRKQKRNRRKLIIFALVLVVFVLAIFLITSALKLITYTIKTALPTKAPIPVTIISKNNLNVNPDGSNPVATLPPYTQNNNILSFIESSDSDKKVCYLTFDDGPNNTVTPQILDILRRYNVKATFFQVGSLIESYPDICRRVYEEGHLIANHSYDHNYARIYANKDSFIEEFNKAAELIKAITGDDYFPIMRFPGGGYKGGTYGEAKQEYKTTLSEYGYYFCDWNALSGDAEGGEKTPKQLKESVKASIGTQNKVVLLMHDAANKKQTAQALPEIIEYLISKGFEFSTLDKPLL